MSGIAGNKTNSLMPGIKNLSQSGTNEYPETTEEKNARQVTRRYIPSRHDKGIPLYAFYHPLADEAEI